MTNDDWKMTIPVPFRAKAVFFVTGLFLIPAIALCQQYADTLPANKNAVLEEFTGVKCGWCPGGHLLLDSILNENPGRVIAVGMHPDNTILTIPYPGNPDFRRTYPDAFFSIPFATDSVLFMPGTFINRRQWLDGRREQYTGKWRAYTDTILSEPSPVNTGLFTLYNLAANVLSVTVEVYYTDTLQSPQTLYVFLTEDSLVAQQNNGGTNYVHNHVFRESLTAQWGDTVINSGMPGTLYTANFGYDNSTTLYNMEHVHVLAMLRDAGNDEIITGKSILANNFTTSAEYNTIIEGDVIVYPNPSSGIFYLTFPSKFSARTIKIFNAAGQSVKEIPCYAETKKTMDLTGLSEGLYFAVAFSDQGTTRVCLVKE